MDPGRPTVMRLIGAVLDQRYRILSLIGEGGMGAVYKAEQVDGPPVAIKVLHEELGDQPELRERFEREARALFGLDHPNILHVTDFGIVDGNPYLAMELLEGQPMDKLTEDGALDPELAYELARQMLDALAFAHANGVLHRDLKSENIWVSRDAQGRPCAKILDFGLAKFTDDDRWGSSKKLTVQGSIMGTPAYMAPEQCAGAPVDTRGDVYSAGVLVFEMFTGVWPFMEETRMLMFQAHFAKPVPPLAEAADHLSFRPELDALIQKAMAKKVDDRFQNAGEMLAALTAIPRPCAVPAGQPFRQASSGAPKLVLVAAALVVLLVLVLAAIVVLATR